MSTLELDQRHETPVTLVQSGAFGIRYAYARSADTGRAGQSGQDYVAIRAEAERLVFVLCDGVGQSFFGEIGSQILGDALLRWLWKLPGDSQGSSLVLEDWVGKLHEYLKTVSASATPLVGEKDLKDIQAGLLREVLEDKRKEGSQSNFVCGAFDAPSRDLQAGRLLLFWLGNAKLQIWRAGTNLTERLEAAWDDRERWSSLTGAVGRVHAYRSDWRQIDCVIGHSDGLDPVRRVLKPALASQVIDQNIDQLRRQPNSDDISFVEISLRNT